MSTRCNIIINGYRGRRIYLYHHHDGYPEGVGVQLRKVQQEHPNLFRYSLTYIANYLLKDGLGLNDKEYEITTGLHSDIEYCYVINIKARSLRCYMVPWDFRRDSEIFKRDNLVEIPAWDGKPTKYERHI